MQRTIYANNLVLYTTNDAIRNIAYHTHTHIVYAFGEEANSGLATFPLFPWLLIQTPFIRK